MKIISLEIMIISLYVSFSKILHEISHKIIPTNVFCHEPLTYDINKNGKMSIFCHGNNGKKHGPGHLEIDLEKDELIKLEELSNYVQIYKPIKEDIYLYVQFNKNLKVETAIIQKDNFYREIIIYNSSDISYEFIDIMTNKDYFILLARRPHTYSLETKPDFFLLMSKYPYESVCKYVNISLSCSYYEKVKSISLNNYFIILFKYMRKYRFIFYIYDLDLNFVNKKNITLSYKGEELIDIKISKLSETEYLDEFLTCFLYQSKSVCYITKYENSDLNFINSYEICSCKQKSNYKTTHMDFYLYYFEQNKNNKILFICDNSDFLIKTHFVYNYTLLLYNYENGIIQRKNEFSFDKHNLVLDDDFSRILINKQGISITYFKNISKYYLTSTCNSTKISLYFNELKEFNLEYLIYEGIDDLSFSFSYIDKNLQIYKNNVRVKENQIFDNINYFTYYLNIDNPENNIDTIYHLKSEIKSTEYSCDIEIQIHTDLIQIVKDYHKCLKNEELERINDIYKTNLNNSFIIDTNNYKDIEIYFTYYKEPKENELIFYYKNFTLNCKSDSKNVTCKIPSIILEQYKKNYIYSKLSCKNIIKVGWILAHDKYIKSIYDLPKTKSYGEIRKIYDPSENIIEYNGNMINYYYWFSCLAYCDDEQIANKKCCPEILFEWEVVYHKEYVMDLNAFIAIINTLIGLIQNPIIVLILRTIFTVYAKSVYYYNFVILKNKKFKKIICGFPGTTNAFQFALEFFVSFSVGIPNKNNEEFSVLKMFYDTFLEIKNDLINNLSLLPEIKDKEYQIIFTGHSLGGALATISSFYCVNHNIIESEPVLITFGQPRVGNELFAKYLTENIKQIYRVARLNDLVTLIPLNGIQSRKFRNTLYFLIDKLNDELSKNEHTKKIYGKYGIDMYKFLRAFTDDIAYFVQKNKEFFKQKLVYCHTGGLYMIDDNKNKIYHCVDFFNENTKHHICKNNDLGNAIRPDFLIRHNYIILGEMLMSKCQKNKSFQYIIFKFHWSNFFKQKQFTVLLEINKYSFQKNKKLYKIELQNFIK